MLAANVSDNSIFSDLDTVRHKSAGYRRAFRDFRIRHDDTVNDLCAVSNPGSGKQNRILDSSVDDTSLCN